MSFPQEDQSKDIAAQAPPSGGIHTEDDMKRDTVSLPPRFEHVEEDNYKPPFCWHGRCLNCWCGCFNVCDRTNQPCFVRCAECFAMYAAHESNMYRGSPQPFKRDKIEHLMGFGKVKAGLNAKTHIMSTDIKIPSSYKSGYEIGVRVFELERPVEDTTARPVLILMHGGGWCTMHPDVRAYHELSSEWASIGYVVYSIDYRLAPENPFPAAVEDCFDVLKWLGSKPDHPCAKLIDLFRITVTGDSAGGNLSLVMSTLVRDNLGAQLEPCKLDIIIERQILLYPANFMDQFVQNINHNTYFLAKPIMDFYMMAYVSGATVQEKQKLWNTDRRINPIMAGLHKLPRTIIVAAEHDRLFPENKILAEYMQKSGTDCVLHTYENMAHGFLVFSFLPASKKCLKMVHDELASSPGFQKEDLKTAMHLV